MPTLSELYGLDPVAAPAAPANKDGQFVSGFKRSFSELPGLAAGVGGYMADVAGADGLRDKALAYAKEKNDAVAADHSTDAASLTDTIDGKTGVGDFIANAAGYVTGQALQAIATGGIGSLGMRAIAKTGAAQLGKEAAAQAIARGASEEVAKKAATDAIAARLTQAAKVGAGVGAGAHNFGMELGSIYPDAVDQATSEGRTLDAGDLARVGLSSGVAAGVDTAMEGVMASRILGGSASHGATFMRRLAREVPEGMLREGGTEALQTAIEHYGAGQPIADEKGLRDIIDSAGVGAVGGGLGGGMASLHAREAAAAPVAPPAPTLGDRLRAQVQPDTGPLTRGVNAGLEAAATRADALHEAGVAPHIAGPLVASTIEPNDPAVSPDAAGGPAETAVGTVPAAPTTAPVTPPVDTAPPVAPAAPVLPMGTPAATGDQSLARVEAMAAADQRAQQVQRFQSQPAAVIPPAPPALTYTEPQAAPVPPSFVPDQNHPGDILSALDDLNHQADQTRKLYQTITAPSGGPLKTKMAANLKAKQVGGEVVPVEGGFVVRVERAPVDATSAAPVAPSVQPTPALVAPESATPATQGARDGQGQEQDQGHRQEGLLNPGAASESEAPAASPAPADQAPIKDAGPVDAGSAPAATPTAQATPAPMPTPAAQTIAQPNDAANVDSVANQLHASIAERAVRNQQKHVESEVAAGRMTREQADRQVEQARADWAARAPMDRTRTIAQAIVDKNPVPLVGAWGQSLTNSEGSARQFEKMTGVKLAGNAAARTKAIFDWAGWTPEQVAAENERRQSARDAKTQEQAARDAVAHTERVRRLAEDTNVKIRETGEVRTVKDHVDGLIARGFDRIKTRKVGAVMKTILANAKGSGHQLPAGIIRDYAEVATKEHADKATTHAQPAAIAEAQAPQGEARAAAPGEGAGREPAAAPAARDAGVEADGVGTHATDSGANPEAATHAVIAESVTKAARTEGRKPADMKRELLAAVDAALEEAPDRQDYLDTVKTMGEKDARAVWSDAKGTMGDKGAPIGYSRPKRTFNIPGDGKFTVHNSTRQLLKFRQQVETSPGFRETPKRPAAERAGDALDRRGTDAAITNMLDEGDFQAAVDFADHKGVSLDDVKLTKVLRDRLTKWQRDTKADADRAEYEARHAVSQPSTTEKARKSAPRVTPQVPSGPMENYIKVAADSISDLRKTDVYRVLVESNRPEYRLAIAEYIKKNRPDLAAEVDDVLAEQARGESPPAVTIPATKSPPVFAHTFDQWVQDKWEKAADVQDAYREQEGGHEKRAMLAAANEGTADLKAAKALYWRELMALPRESSITKEVYDGLTQAQKGDAQHHFFNLDSKVIRWAQEESKATAKAREPAAVGDRTQDSGAELTYNRRNRVKTGIGWSDIADKNQALKVKEATKTNVSPRPDYEALVAGGMQPMVAHLVKQVYDAIATKPQVRGAPTDAQLKTYIETVQQAMAGVMAWANDKAAVAAWAEKQASRMGARTGVTALSPGALAGAAQSLLDHVFPGGWKNQRDGLVLAGGNKLLGALQPGYDETTRATKAVQAGFPASQEAWEKRGFKVVAKDDVASIVPLDYGDKNFGLKILNRTTGFKTREEAQAAHDALAPALLLDKNNRLVDSFDSEDAAVEAARERTKRDSKTGPDEGGTNVFDARREGPARRMEGEDVSSDHLRETFGFKGINFGNWMKGDTSALSKERQAHLNHAFDAFMDLADLFGVPPRAMSLNGMLGLAFGAQGNGKYAAHFVPGVNEINLTRNSGAGALAHEFGHALDHYFASLGGIAGRVDPFLTEHTATPLVERKVVTENGQQKMVSGPIEGATLRPEVFARFKDIVQAMNRKPETIPQYMARMKAAEAAGRERVESWLRAIKRDFMAAKVDEAKFDALAERIRSGDVGDGYVAASSNTDISPAVDQLRELYKAAAGRTYPLDNIKGLQSNLDAQRFARDRVVDETTHVPQQVGTDYAKAAAALDEGKGGKRYWSTDLEKFARAFDAFVSDKLAERASKNTYLHGLNKDERTVPVGEERTAINKAIQSLIDTIDTQPGEGGNVAMFSRGEDAAAQADDTPAARRGESTPSPAAAAHAGRLRTFTQAVTDKWANAPEVIVAASMQDPAIPQAVRDHDQQQKSQGATGEPEGFFYKGKVYLVADQLRGPSDALRVLLHESLGHYGLRSVFGKELSTILDRMAILNAGKVRAKARQYGLDFEKQSDRRTAAEEVLAEMAQDHPELGWVKRAVAAIRSWLRDNVPGFSTMKMTDDEVIRSFLLPAREYVKGLPQARAGGDLAMAFQRATGSFSRSPDVLKDATGAPLTVYHGTPLASESALEARNGGLFFTSKRDVAKGYTLQRGLWRSVGTGGSVREAHLSMRNPLVIDAQGKRNDNIPVPWQEWKPKVFGNLPAGAVSVTAALKEAIARGHDGLIVRNVVDTASPTDKTKSDVYAVPSTDQVHPAGEADPAMFSRSLGDALASGMATAHDIALPAGYKVGDLLNSSGTLSWWHKTVGTPFNLAERSPVFKKVYDATQKFLNDVSLYATEAADLAPRILPKLDGWKDIAKTPLSAADTKAVSAPIFEGTLTWTRDEAGKPVKVEDAQALADQLSVDDKAHAMLRGGHLDPKVLRMWQGLPVDQYEQMIHSRHTSTMVKPGIVFTPAELKRLFGLNDHQVSLYQEFRAATDKSLANLAISDMIRFGGDDVRPVAQAALDTQDVDKAAEMLRDYLFDQAEQDPDRATVLNDTANRMIDKADRARELMEQGYAPLSRFGQYTLDVVDDAGERVYFGLFESAADRSRMARKMAANYPGATISQGTTSQEEYKMFAGVSPETLALFGEMLGLEKQGDDPASQVFQEYLKRAKNNRSAMKRLIQRKGIAGFSEDAGRVLAGFVYSNARQTASNLHMGAISDAVQEIPQGQGQLKDYAVRLMDYVKNPQQEAQGLRGLLFTQYLGGSVASAMVNATQPIAVTFPYISQHVGVAGAAKIMGAAMKAASRKGGTGDATLDAALKKAEEEGIVSPQEVHQLQAQAAGRATLKSGDGTTAGNAYAKASNVMAKVMLAWGQVFSVAEQFNRRVTFIAAYRAAQEKGIADPAAFAAKAVAETQFTYNKGNRAPAARGALGALAFTFKSYSVQYLELLHRMYKSGPEGKRAALLAIGVLFLMSGADGLPGSDDLSDLIDGLMQRLGYNWSTKQEKRKFFASIVGEGGAQFLAKGLSGIPGAPIDVSGRIGMGNLIPATGLFTKKADHSADLLELAGPAGDLAKRTAGAVNSLAGGDLKAAATGVLPTAAANLAKAYDMATTGAYHDARGYKVIDTDGYDAAAKAIGFQPHDVSAVQEATGEAQRYKALHQLRTQEISEKWAQGLATGDPSLVDEAKADRDQWNENNPDVRLKVNMPSILKRVREMKTPKADRIAATSPTGVRAKIKADLREAQ